MITFVKLTRPVLKVRWSAVTWRKVSRKRTGSRFTWPYSSVSFLFLSCIFSFLYLRLHLPCRSLVLLLVRWGGCLLLASSIVTFSHVSPSNAPPHVRAPAPVFYLSWQTYADEHPKIFGAIRGRIHAFSIVLRKTRWRRERERGKKKCDILYCFVFLLCYFSGFSCHGVHMNWETCCLVIHECLYIEYLYIIYFYRALNIVT